MESAILSNFFAWNSADEINFKLPPTKHKITPTNSEKEFESRVMH